jgi:hypothetical protein
MEWKEVSIMDRNERVKSPGLKYRKRRTGPPVPYWFADPKAIEAGYPVRAANLSAFADRPTFLKERAERLQSEMLKWMAGERDTAAQFDGTFRSLLDLYESDKESDYNTKLKPGVQNTYGVYIRRLIGHIGELRIDHQDGRDLKRWFAQWRTDPDGSDHLPRARMVLAVLKAAISFGVACRNPGCRAFQEVMAQIEFPKPQARIIRSDGATDRGGPQGGPRCRRAPSRPALRAGLRHHRPHVRHSWRMATAL